jgi:hypothetical protein
MKPNQSSSEESAKKKEHTFLGKRWLDKFTFRHQNNYDRLKNKSLGTYWREKSTSKFSDSQIKVSDEMPNVKNNPKNQEKHEKYLHSNIILLSLGGVFALSFFAIIIYRPLHITIDPKVGKFEFKFNYPHKD